MKKAAYCSAFNTFLSGQTLSIICNYTCNYTVCVVSHSVPVFLSCLGSILWMIQVRISHLLHSDVEINLYVAYLFTGFSISYDIDHSYRVKTLS